ncbi:polyphosphate kinase 1 [Halarchaeum nitratireducens]|uniref:Polyphosphate kinase n=1 Tax=Halarchaeum nitratireducens TaxID=489913 RepID=A0A830GD96_9EURY|nr:MULTISPECIES: polyphosphate kinase 1 [Halarchaeum]MBP2251786.1 polyphosphate kinase [Halarchaeum solikamskense]GGN22305.1 polyphosphate kinase [Halarchaeum nitratireducens]
MTEPDLADPTYYLNRELSELAFQERVLSEALDERNPPLERLRFLAYFTKNTDEFFMKRVGGLEQQMDAGVTETTPDGRTPEEQWEEVLETARPLFERQSDYWLTELRPALADAGIEVVDCDDLADDERDALRAHFEESILPTLTPLAFDPAHPFPFISNLSLSLAVLSRGADGEETFTRIKIPSNQPRLVAVPNTTGRYVLIENVIEANLDVLLPDLDVVDVSKFRVTRNAEVRRNEEVAEDLIDIIEDVLDQRRFATVVRLEVDADMPERAVDILKENLDVSEREVFYREGPLDFEDFFELTELDRPDLKLDPWTPKPHPRLRPSAGDATDDELDIFREIREGEILVHHPYHSFEGTVQRFLDAAANDPNVLAVKAAIYRTASDSKVIQSLIDAADNGKQVAVMVELKARFDEKNNLEWVRRLEEEGIHVAYGTVGLKTHTKTALVVRQEADGVQLYSHVGTGNYHSQTAKGYSDLGLLSADRDIGQDLTKVFNFFTGPTLDDQFRKLLIAPVTMRERFVEMIRREAAHARNGRPTRIVAKVNGLEDPEIVAELYRASMAGVEIDLIVRDICRLRPGLDDVSENIAVHSIVGRFLEHARVFYFENGARSTDPHAADGAGEPEWYIGSADWMTRNLDYRVEAVTPVETPALRAQLRFILELSLRDNRRRWVMQSDGSYEQATPGADEAVCDLQETLMRAATDAVESGYGPGFEVDEELIDGELLIEPAPETRPDATSVDDGSRELDGADGPAATASVADPDDVGHAPDTGVVETTEHATDHAEAIDAANDAARSTRPETDADSIFERQADHWYRPESETYRWAVRTADGDRRYFKTREGARERLRIEYE